MTLINKVINTTNSLSVSCENVFNGIEDCAKRAEALAKQILKHSSDKDPSSFRLRKSPSMETIYIERETLGNGAFSEAINIDRYRHGTGEYSASSVYKCIKPISDQSQHSISRADQVRSLEREWAVSSAIPEDKKSNLALPFKADYDPTTKEICGLHVKKYGPSLDRIDHVDNPLEFFTRQYTFAAKGLKNLHDCGYTHRDIHPGNIFSETADLSAALGDFGCSSNDPKEKIRGQIRLLPQEFKKRGKIIDAPFHPCADIFAFGKAMLETLNEKINLHYNKLFNLDLTPVQSPNTVNENVEKLLAANCNQNLASAYNDYATIAINCSLLFAQTRSSIQEAISELEALSYSFNAPSENIDPSQKSAQKISRLALTETRLERAYSQSSVVPNRYAY